MDVEINTDVEMNKIAVSTGIEGLDVTFKAGGIYIAAKEESGGIYDINASGSGDVISYFVNGGDNYSDAEGEITTSGSDITVSLSIKTADTLTFTRPNLTENGELGGDSFAVACTGLVNKKTVFTHYEFGKTHPKTTSYGKIDFTYLPYLPNLQTDRVGGYLRNKIQWYILQIKKGV